MPRSWLRAESGVATAWNRIFVKAGAANQRREALPRIKPLGIELVGDDAALGMHDDLAADQSVAVAGQGALAAHEMVLIDPFPRARLEMAAHPFAVHQIHDQRAARGERPPHRFEHREIVLGPVEIAERIAEDADAVEVAVAEPKAARVAFVKRHRQVALAGPLAGEPDQIARAVEAGDIAETAPRQFQRMPPLAAAQVEDAVVRAGSRRPRISRSTSCSVLRSFSTMSPSVSR